ncbi:MAG TPA: 50S ribosomal protein L11 methyltransferase [Gaiellaceae bacterium]|nr:50S ribosomal protein L11 methyltransferase [Gaiellaceae bacterium]
MSDARLEEARARLLELHPEGFEEAEGELAVYTDADGERRLRAHFGDVTSSPLEPGWAERWREFHRPVWIGPLWVGPPWEEPPDDALAVVVDPGRAFGTGSHPTTRLCLEFLVDLESGSLLDLGSGSGVLAVAAAKLGFAPVTGIDHEPAAVEAARRNAEANGVTVEFRLGNVLVDPLPSADVAVANIDLSTVEKLGAVLDVPLLVTAGYFHSRLPEICGYVHRERRVDGGWAADRFVRQ